MSGESSNPLEGVVPVGLWLSADAENIFPTASAWEFFRRSHKAELVKEGALILGSGRRADYVDRNRIGKIVLDILLRESVARLGGSI